MEKLVTSEVKLGIIAGGQLGKMLVLSASNWNVKTYVLDKDDHCPASTSCTFFYKGDQLNFDDVYRFGQLVDVLTLAGTFWAFSIMGILSGIWGYYLIPETKGKSLEYIEEHWRQGKTPREL